MILSAVEIEKRIIESYELPNNVLTTIPEPMVTVHAITYQHVLYIRDCIEGILMQKTTFPVECIIGEDFSTDGTREIVFEYAKKYPDKIRVFTADYNVGARVNFARCRRISRGKYIAICEGDDYWIDENKLQLQIDFMEKNKDCSMSFHAVNYIDANTKLLIKNHRNDIQSRFFSMEELILGGGGLVGTQSIVIRNNVLTSIPEFYEISPAGDYPLVLLSRSKGSVYYIDKTMAVYRTNNPESAMGQINRSSATKYIDRYIGFARMLYEFNIYTHDKYSNAVKKKSSSLVFNAFRRVKSNLKINERFKQFMSIKVHLVLLHKFISLFLVTLPFPGSKTELSCMKNKLVARLKKLKFK